MRKLLAGACALVMTSGAGLFGTATASADETPLVPTPTDEIAYALGGAHVLGIPYDEYIRREGAGWLPTRRRQIVDYPAGQVQGHVLGRLFPGIDRLDGMLPGLGVDGPSVGESVVIGADNLAAAIEKGGPGTVIGLSEGALVLDDLQARLATDPNAPPPDQLTFNTFGDPVARHAFGESFLTAMFPVGSIVPALDYQVPPPVDSQYDTRMFISAYDSIADFPDRPDNWMSLANTLVGLATGHTAVAFTDPSMVPPQNIRTTVNSRGAKVTTVLIPERHLPLVLPFQYLGVDEGTLNKLDAVLLPSVNAGYSRNDDPLTAPVQVDPVNGYDPAAVTAPATQATFGGGADPISQILSGAMSVLNRGGR